MGDGLGRVDHAAAADGQDQICAEFDRPFYALAGQLHARIGLHTADGVIRDQRLVQQRKHPVKKAAALGAAAAVDHQHAASAVLFHKLCCAANASLAENHVRFDIILKALHSALLIPRPSRP